MNRNSPMASTWLLTAAVPLLLAAACGGPAGQPASLATDGPTASVRSSDRPLDPADFVATVDNPYFPLVPGSHYRYEGTSDGRQEVVVVEVTDQTKQILGIAAVVVRDTVTHDGQVVEDTYDWFAQDRAGAVWYLGEDVKDYENGQLVSTAGSWEAGVDGARPGIIMPAKPRVGETYQQEYYEGEAEDAAEVLATDDQVTVPYGAFSEVVKTRDFTPLEPATEEHKYYAPGVGPVLTVDVANGSTRLELVDVVTP